NHVMPGQGIRALGGGTASTADQAAKPAIAAPVDGDRDKFQAAFEPELGADEQLQVQQLCRHMCSHNSRDGAFVGEGERAVAQDTGALDELLRMRSATEESEVADAMQLRVRSAFQGTAHPNTPCRNQRCGSARSRKIHSWMP